MDDLRTEEHEDAEERSAPRPVVVYEAIRMEGEDELARPVRALAWSGLAAGLSMGFSFVAQGLIRAHLPDAPWRILVTAFGYSIGFLVVVLGRQQLFTENTLTPVLPLLATPSGEKLGRVARLWAVVLAANLVGTLAFAWVLTHARVFEPDTDTDLLALALEGTRGTFGVILLRGVFAGWLIALMVWLMPGAQSSRPAVIILITYVIGIAQFAHVVAGSVEAFYAPLAGAGTWSHAIGGWLAPALLGNILGGTALVAALNHAQVTAGS